MFAKTETELLLKMILQLIGEIFIYLYISVFINIKSTLNTIKKF